MLYIALLLLGSLTGFIIRLIYDLYITKESRELILTTLIAVYIILSVIGGGVSLLYFTIYYFVKK